MSKEINKKLLVGAGATALSLVGAWWLKNKKPMTPKIPNVDNNTIILFQFNYSPYCIKVAKVMDYKGIPYKTVNILPIVNKNFIKELSNQSKVPVIKHKNKVIHDSTKIALYLEDICPEPSLFINDDHKLNEEVKLWEDWADEAFLSPFSNLAVMYLYEHPEYLAELEDIKTGIGLIDNNKERLAPFITKMQLKAYGADLSKKDELKKKARGYLDTLLKKLENKEFIVGDRLTIADITIASHLTVAQKVPYISEDEHYEAIFIWQKKIFDLTKRRVAATIS
ncbi:MAG: glutathione S-transferase family protein [Candidatus Sericytochromatia bacterium]|nr:glutathione S-transferase family protein [Candidatus Sericytochromatia bacterium]